MLRLKKGLILAAFCLSAAFARADTLRLVAPASGATLRGGSFAELLWSASRLPPSAEEWEAFLSIDGGKYYAFRVTPHLDIDLQRFTFVVPNVDTRDARILIRTGNEVNETRFESRGSFSIVRDSKAEEIVPSLLRWGRGEAARDGDPAVIAWAGGSRNGDSVTQQSSPAVPPPSFGRPATVTHESPALMAPASNSVIVASVESAPLVDQHTHTSRTERLSISADLLLVCSRRNV